MRPRWRVVCVVIIGALALTACGGPIQVPTTSGRTGSSSDVVWACATVEEPHTVYDPTVCPASRDAVAVLGDSGIEVRWYSALRDEVGPDERAEVGSPLASVWHANVDTTTSATSSKTPSRRATATETS